MAVEKLSGEQIEGLVGSAHPLAGFEYPVNGLQPYYRWLIGTLHLLGESSAGVLRVAVDDANGTTVHVAGGRATVGGVVVVYGGGTVDLGVYNNQTAYVWLDVSGVGAGADTGGWPTAAHVKLAEVTLASGVITVILDRRFETIIHAGLGHSYGLAITTAGSTGSASTVTVSTSDLQGNPIAGQGILRVRVCDSGGYVVATNATIAPGTNTTTLETVTTGKELVLRGHSDGTYRIDVTDATAETVTLRIGSPPLSGLRADYSPTIALTHA